jgi:hypothetical protein
MYFTQISKQQSQDNNNKNDNEISNKDSNHHQQQQVQSSKKTKLTNTNCDNNIKKAKFSITKNEWEENSASKKKTNKQFSLSNQSHRPSKRDDSNNKNINDDFVMPSLTLPKIFHNSSDLNTNGQSLNSVSLNSNNNNFNYLQPPQREQKVSPLDNKNGKYTPHSSNDFNSNLNQTALNFGLIPQHFTPFPVPQYSIQNSQYQFYHQQLQLQKQHQHQYQQMNQDKLEEFNTWKQKNFID